jgi:hypothetical protein
MPQPIVYVDTSAIRNGKLEELQAAMKTLASFVEANVPQLVSYGFFLNEDRTQNEHRCRSLATPHRYSFTWTLVPGSSENSHTSSIC